MQNGIELRHAIDEARKVVASRSSRTTLGHDDRRFRSQQLLTASRRLRRAATATVTELDAAVLDDLMKIVKLLRQQAVSVEERGEEKTELALRLLDQAMTKGTPRSPDHILWMFNKFYGEADKIIEREKARAQSAKGGAQ
jgi:hypothetical protein